MTNTANPLRVQVESCILFSYNDYLLSGQDIEILEDRIVPVNGRDAAFALIAGPTHFNKNNYILEIHYREAEEAHRRSLPGEGWGKSLYRDFAEQAHQIASAFCQENNFVIKSHLNSWPEYQAIIRKRNILAKLIIPE